MNAYSKNGTPPFCMNQSKTVFHFVEAHPDLYHKGHAAFRKTHRKDALSQLFAYRHIKGHTFLAKVASSMCGSSRSQRTQWPRSFSFYILYKTDIFENR